MANRFKLGDIAVDVALKDIKNVHLSVHPPSGKVRISAPKRMTPDLLRVFAISKLSWIKQQQKKLQRQERETRREYLDRESHYVWGKRYLMKVIEEDASASIELKHSTIHLRIRAGSDIQAKQIVLARWYRQQIRSAVPNLIAKWEEMLGINVERIFVQKMKTKWGSCNPRARTIRLNTELAKKPPEALEYILVHEMIHLLEPHHNTRFVHLMDHVMPQWRVCRERLNQLPVCHEQWVY